MASLVADNPFDTTPQKFAGTGDVSGLITGGAKNGNNWDFMDQQGKVLTSIPYADYASNYQTNAGVVRDGITSVNGVPVYNFNGQSSQPAGSAVQPAFAAPRVNEMQPATGLIGGAMTPQSPTTGELPSNVGMSASVSPNVATYAPVTRQVDQATETAAGQVNSILSKDSPLMARARTLATQQMAQRGLVNSSMAQGAGVAAMIDRATPIAQQDAQTYSNRALANMEATNQSGQFNAGELNKFGLQKSDQIFTAGENAINRTFQTSERMGSQDFTAGENTANRTLQTTLQTAQFDFQKAQADLERAFQTTQQDKSIQAQANLQTAQQTFQDAQSRLDRLQQATLSKDQIASNERLTLAQIDATAKNLGTSNAAQMEQIKMQITNNQSEAGKNYAATLALNATNQINALMADSNLSSKPEDGINGVSPKQAAIDNLIKTTNSSLQWASTFYNITLPGYSAPGGVVTNLAPGEKYTQSQANQALSNLMVTDPNSSYTNVVKSGLQLGYTMAQIDAAYAANNISKNNAVSGANASTADTARAAASNNVTSSAAAAPAAPSNTEISSYVSSVLANGGSSAEQAAAINQAAASSGVTREQIAAATGYSLAQVNAFLQ